MNAMHQERGLSGPGTLAIALLLLTPSVVAFFASSAAAHQADFPASALWFTYQMSLYFGVVGVAIVVALILSAAIRRRFSPVFTWLMAIFAIGAVILLWYASHTYRNPWVPNTWPVVM